VALEAADRVAGQGSRESQQEGGSQKQPAESAGAGSTLEHQRRSGGQTRQPDSRQACEADRRTQQVRDRPPRVVGKLSPQRGEDADLGDARDQGTEHGDFQNPLDTPDRAGLTSPAEHNEREERPPERDRLACEPGGAQPHEYERDHGRATLTPRAGRRLNSGNG
jgi:hypothetical protein